MLSFEDLTPKLQTLSQAFAPMTLDGDPEDIYQEMALTLLEREQTSPDFSDQTESYIVHAGRMRAWTLARDRQIFNRHNAFVSDDPESDDSWFDMFPGHEDDPEEALIRKQELAAIVGSMRLLSRREGEILSLVVVGVRASEISERTGDFAACRQRL